MFRFSAFLLSFFLLSLAMAQSPTPGKFPGVLLEAEDFKIQSGWKVLTNGQGNYMVDIIGFNHISGERLLSLPAGDEKGLATANARLSENGQYRLWVRYEYPVGSDCSFEVQVVQKGKVVFSTLVGSQTALRYGLGDPVSKAQHDPSWGSEGLMEEAFTTPELEAGEIQIQLKGAGQEKSPWVFANRNVDLVLLTRDLGDAGIKEKRKGNNLYPFLDLVRELAGARFSIRFTNESGKAASYSASHIYNRSPWGINEGLIARDIPPGKKSEWVPLFLQDTCHFGATRFNGPGEFTVEIKPVAGGKIQAFNGNNQAVIFIPPYPDKGEQSVSVEAKIQEILGYLASSKPIGKKPIQPFCYGGWMPLGQDNEYGKYYAKLYAALGFRSYHPANSGTHVEKNMAEVGIPPSKSAAISSYRNPPTPNNIAKALLQVKREKLEGRVRWFDYGDEIAFSEWLDLALNEQVAALNKGVGKVKAETLLAAGWKAWLEKKRPQAQLRDYWLPDWGNPDPMRMKPDSSAKAALQNPVLYVDSLEFYETYAISQVAQWAKNVRDQLGQDVLCGANYSCHPFYYPPVAMYVRWFRSGAAELGRHSEYYWQVTQPSPLGNGYIAEMFSAGMRKNPRAVLRQYTMPHAPGNTDEDFLRTAFTHLAHGAKMLDFFGIGLNETFTENHVDHRALSRFRAIRDVTHAVGFVEDLLPQSVPAQSEVAILVSESTERWDFAGIAQDRAGHAWFGPDFRKTRLHYHLDRLGLWKALTFLGHAPDLIIEEDINQEDLRRYKVLFLTGDCLPPELAAVLQDWVSQGGHLVASAGAGRFDKYKSPILDFQNLLGLEARLPGEITSLIRPGIELPPMKPTGFLQGEKWKLPNLGPAEKILPGKEARVLGKWEEDGSPAVVAKKIDKGSVVTFSTLPGLGFLWSCLQPPRVPDRGINVHRLPDFGQSELLTALESVLADASLKPWVTSDPPLVDKRLIKKEGGDWFLPLANYQSDKESKISFKIRLPGKPLRVESAFLGSLPFQEIPGGIQVVHPKLGPGDILRFVMH
ncbi:MAG: hypothetical protein EXR99_04305 [Gemmataceae bacterium]|nr:hypothetical protein [Gemmataceae bacterium]